MDAGENDKKEVDLGSGWRVMELWILEELWIDEGGGGEERGDDASDR